MLQGLWNWLFGKKLSVEPKQSLREYALFDEFVKYFNLTEEDLAEIEEDRDARVFRGIFQAYEDKEKRNLYSIEYCIGYIKERALLFVGRCNGYTWITNKIVSQCTLDEAARCEYGDTDKVQSLIKHGLQTYGT